MAPQIGIPVVDWFLALLDSLGYLIVFGFTIFENLFVIGSLTPGETVVVAAAFVAAQGSLMIAGVWLASVLGTVLGSNISYWLGRRAGLDAVRAFVQRVAATRIGRLLRISDDGLDDVRAHFHRDGAKTVLISRFAIGAKNFVPAVAGATCMPVFWFEAYTVLGAILYTSIMCAIGWFLGYNLGLAMQVVSAIGYAGLGLLALLVIGAYFLQRRIRARRLADSDDAD